MTEIYPIVANNGFCSMPVVRGGQGECWMQNSRHLPAQKLVNADELTSLSAMIAYISATSGKSEYRLERSLADRFNVPNAKWLPASQFNLAIRYLVDELDQAANEMTL